MKNLAFLFLLFMLPFGGFSQSKKVGLALSGGGAKGMAHIGALRAIEEAGIQIDYISGTSMGAVVGAMYALGYSIDEIEKYLTEVDWEAVLSDEIPRNHLNYIDRQSRERYLLDVNISKTGISLPNAFNYGHQMLKTLNYLTQRGHGQSDFEKFDIPFMCVATDLVTGEEIHYSNGNLPEALRASVSFPSVFSPYEYQGVLCVDGGVKNNLPIKVLKEKGVDYIIAIDVQGLLYEKEELNSLVDVLEQVGSFQNAELFEAQKPLVDLWIRPNVDGIGIMDYDQSPKLIKEGYNEALQSIKNSNTIPVQKKSVELIPKKYGPPLEKVIISSILVEGNLRYSDGYIIGQLDLKLGREYSINRIERGLDRLFGSEGFNSVTYQLLPEEGGYRLKVKVSEKKQYGKLRFSGHYDDDFKMAILGNITWDNLLIKGSKFTFDLAVGNNPRTEVTYLIQPKIWPGFGLTFKAFNYDGNFYSNFEKIDEFRMEDASFNAYTLATWWDILTVGAGIEFQRFKISKTLPLDEIEPQLERYFNYYGFVELDALDRLFKPTKGLRINFEAKIINDSEYDLTGLQEPSSIIKVDYRQVIPIYKTFNAEVGLNSALTIGPDLAYPYSAFVGGMGKKYPHYAIPFAGYRFQELYGRNALTMKLELNYEFYPKNYLTAIYNFGGIEPDVTSVISSETWIDGWGFSYGYNSVVGPLELTVMGNRNTQDIYTYIALGFWF